MKNLTKILMAVVVAMAAYACTTDTTETLGVQIDGGENYTTLTLTLEEPRVQLGNKSAEGLYPLYWSAGDAIAVNGVASKALTAEQAGNSSATFNLNGVLNYPYNIVYPAPAEGVAAATVGCYPVVFPATQEYVKGNIDGKSAPMYGYKGSESAALTLNHLTGILRFAVKGDVILSNMMVAAESGCIAGTYDVNCETGALTPQDGSTNGSISISFGEGLELDTEEATLIHVAVPAGNYGAVSIVLNTVDDQHMYAKFSSEGEKAIKAGTVREFDEFVFVANSEIDTVVFEISDIATLNQFAELVANNKFYPRNEAKLVASIDMSDEEWTPIDGFNYTFNGNNQTITGLTAPLFGSAGATVKDLTLADVNIASNGRLTLGAVACVLTDGSISNCKVSGTITVNNTAATIASDSNADTTVNIGGVVGTSQGDVDGCVNEANITVNQVAKSANTVAVHPSVGGVVGYSVAGAVTNCVNGNEAKTAGAINYHDTHATQLYVPHVGGVAGRGAADNTSAFTDNTNYGAISFKANGAGDTSISYESITVAGVVGCSYGNIENNGNYGTITIAQSAVKALYVGGVVSVAIPTATPFKNNHNYTGANITIDSDVTFHCLTVAGVLSGLNGGLADASGGGLFNCSNDGAINVKASTASDITLATGNYYRIGGVVGYINRSVQDCENKANGDITLEGNVVLTRNNYQSGFNVAGVYAYQSTSGSHKDNTNRGDINLYTNVSKHSSLTSTTPEVDGSDRILYKMDIGGVAGHVQRPPVGKEENFGLITIGKADGTVQNITANGIYISGVIAQRYNRTVGADSSAVNHGDITINSGVTLNGFTVGVFIGGCTAYNGTPNSGNTTKFYNYSNSGDIVINGDINDLSYIGGVIAYANGASISTSSNTGAISLGSTAAISGNAYIGGAVGYTSAAELSTVKNNTGGNITIDGTISGQSYIGGVTSTYAGTLNSCETHGNILFNGTYTAQKHLYIAGITGCSTSASITSCSNTGNITIDKCGISSITIDDTTDEYSVCMSGVVGYQETNAATFTGCSNSGVLTVSENVRSNFVLKVGGVLGGTKKSIVLDNCHNSMKSGVEYGIVLKNTISAGDGSNQSRAGGLIGWQNGGNLTTRNGVSNSAGLYIACINKETGGSSYGGVAGVLGGNAHSFGGIVSNSGNIYYAGASHAGTLGIGGLFGQTGNNVPSVCEDLRNTGDITIVKGTNWKPTGAKKSGYIGGVAGLHLVALSNAQSVCTITAIDFEDDHGNDGYYNAVGGIVGSAISANLSNCHCGGSIILTDTNTPGVLSVSNYAAYLSGDHTFSSATAKSQSCGYISTIGAKEEYAE